jgi:hypothetical protein
MVDELEQFQQDLLESVCQMKDGNAARVTGGDITGQGGCNGVAPETQSLCISAGASFCIVRKQESNWRVTYRKKGKYI